MTSNHTIRTWRGVVATAIASGAFLGGLAFGASPIASAEWDNAEFQRCFKTPHTTSSDVHFHYCCVVAGGGTYNPAGAGGNTASCTAQSPPAQGPATPTTGKPDVGPPQVEADEAAPIVDPPRQPLASPVKNSLPRS